MSGPTARLIQVIETTLTTRGEGVDGDPIRRVTQYWSTDGRLLAEVDTWSHEIIANRMVEISNDGIEGMPHHA